MRILVTGAAGFLGRALVHVLRVGHDVIATDRDDGDIAEREHVGHLFARPIDRVFHLAAIVSGAAEADFAAGQRANLEATLRLLDCCRAQAARGGPVVRLVYASSIAVFGTPLPERIDDRTAPAPSLSYGTHKRVCELLVDDASRRGELAGRCACPASSSGRRFPTARSRRSTAT
jgi:nucleoside-diphosphate-sugar epimerase